MPTRERIAHRTPSLSWTGAAVQVVREGSVGVDETTGHEKVEVGAYSMWGAGEAAGAPPAGTTVNRWSCSQCLVELLVGSQSL
jgi:hypothetical protein